jgi:hypothetical protein
VGQRSELRVLQQAVLLRRLVLLRRQRVSKAVMLRALPGNVDQPGDMVRCASEDGQLGARTGTFDPSLALCKGRPEHFCRAPLAQATRARIAYIEFSRALGGACTGPGTGSSKRRTT